SEAIYSEIKPSNFVFPMADAYTEVRVVDTFSESLSEIGYFRMASAAIFHAPLHHYSEPNDFEGAVINRAENVSSDLLLSMVAHVAHSCPRCSYGSPSSPSRPDDTNPLVSWIDDLERHRRQSCNSCLEYIELASR